MTSAENRLRCPLMITLSEPCGSAWPGGKPWATSASALPNQSPPATGALHEAQDKVPQTLSP